MEDNIIILEDENGAEVEFETIDVFEYENVIYFALVEVMPEGAESDEVLLMQVSGDIDGDDAELIMIDDEEQLQAAYNEFCRRDAEAS